MPQQLSLGGEMVDARDLKSLGQKCPYEFESRSRYYKKSNNYGKFYQKSSFNYLAIASNTHWVVNTLFRQHE